MDQMTMLDAPPAKQPRTFKKGSKSIAEAKTSATLTHPITIPKQIATEAPMSNLQDLLKQQEELQKEIERIRAESKKAALSKIDALMFDYGLSPQDVADHLGFKRGVSSGETRVRKSPKPKYHDPVTNTYWSGRGRMNKHMAEYLRKNPNKTIEDLLIKDS